MIALPAGISDSCSCFWIPEISIRHFMYCSLDSRFPLFFLLPADPMPRPLSPGPSHDGMAKLPLSGQALHGHVSLAVTEAGSEPRTINTSHDSRTTTQAREAAGLRVCLPQLHTLCLICALCCSGFRRGSSRAPFSEAWWWLSAVTEGFSCMRRRHTASWLLAMTDSAVWEEGGVQKLCL